VFTYESSVTLNFNTLYVVVNEVAHEFPLVEGGGSGEIVLDNGEYAELDVVWFQWYPGTSDAPEGTVMGITSLELVRDA
jgi:hypothetical protein